LNSRSIVDRRNRVKENSCTDHKM